MSLSLRYYGDPVLRKRAEEVAIFDEALQLFAEALLKEMFSRPAAGLAAPQVGKSIRMFARRNFVVKEDDTIEYTDSQIFVNPVITVIGDELEEDQEGCLSIPDLRADVVRPKHIRVEAFDQFGKPFVEELEGYKARIVMHENDHLNGVLFIDRLDPRDRKAIDAELRSIKKKYASK